jgi:hypothetical protein
LTCKATESQVSQTKFLHSFFFHQPSQFGFVFRIENESEIVMEGDRMFDKHYKDDSWVHLIISQVAD